MSNVSLPRRKLGDLLYHEGPLLSIYQHDPDSSYYLCKWTDSDETCNRWLYFPTAPAELAMFFFQKSSLLDLIKKSTWVFLIDIDNDINTKQIIVTTADRLPASYFPYEDSYFCEDDFTAYAADFRNTFLNANFPLLLDEELARLKNYTFMITQYYHHISSEDVSNFQRQIQNIHNLLINTGK